MSYFFSFFFFFSSRRRHTRLQGDWSSDVCSSDLAADVVAHILDREPAPLARYVKDPPGELQRIVSKALMKNRDERYQTMKDLLLDLKALKQEMEFTAKLERLSAPGDVAAYRTGGAAAESSNTPELIAANSSTRPVSSAEFIFREIKQHKRGVLVAFSVLLLAAVALGVWHFARRSSSSAQIKSIAVMPFVNQSGNQDVEYLSDGMTETLINTLSQLPDLSVKARSSVFRYKGKEVEPQTVGNELNVQAIVNGRVVQRGDDLTLYLSLVDTRTGDQLWGEQYNRKQADLLSLQNTVARDVATKLRNKLSGADEQKVAKNFTQNTEAYQLYLQGRFFANKRTPQSIQKAIEYYQQAIGKDPNYALGYAGLSDGYGLLAYYSAAPAPQALSKAREAALRALALDNNLAEAHNALGFVLTIADYDYEA